MGGEYSSNEQRKTAQQTVGATRRVARFYASLKPGRSSGSPLLPLRPPDMNLPRQTVINGKLGMTDLENVAGKALHQFQIAAGQYPHTHQFLHLFPSLAAR